MASESARFIGSAVAVAVAVLLELLGADLIGEALWCLLLPVGGGGLTLFARCRSPKKNSKD